MTALRYAAAQNGKVSIVHSSKINVVSSFTIAAFAVLAFSACGTESNAEPAPASESGAQSEESTTEGSSGSGTAEFTVGDSVYTAQLEFCTLQGQEDALFHGVASDESGAAVGYLDGDFTRLTDAPTGEARIDFGATGQFESADEFIAVGDAMSHFVVTDASDSHLWIVGGAWDQDGTKLPSSTLKIEC